eukprot:gene9494-biopygen22731
MRGGAGPGANVPLHKGSTGESCISICRICCACYSHRGSQQRFTNQVSCGTVTSPRSPPPPGTTAPPPPPPAAAARSPNSQLFASSV